jgi:integrase
MNTAIIPSPTPFDVSAITRANLATSTKQQYIKAIRNMITAGVNPTDYHQLAEYAVSLRPSSKAFLKSALRLMTLDVELAIKAGATPENIGSAQAGVMRLQAMRDAVQTETPKGRKISIWLSAAQVAKITSLCNGEDITSRRDWIVLALGFACGLRRDEIVHLEFSAMKELPTKGKLRTVLEITHSKGSKVRQVAINDKLAIRLREWHAIVGDGFIVRSLGRTGQIGESMSSRAVYEIFEKYAARIGVENFPAHSARRTFAQLSYEAGIPLVQISVTLGHSTVAVTQKYLDLSIPLDSVCSDFIPLS